MEDPASAPSIPGGRRSVSAWGAFLGGQAAIGGNLFVALGLVIEASRGGAGLAYALSGLVFLLVGLGYVEMVASLPVAGGGQYFVLRGLGDFWGFIAGSALILDLTIGIALFAAMAASYLNTFTPALLGVDAGDLTVTLPGLGSFEWFWFAEAVALTVLLVALNCRGLRESVRLTSWVGVAILAGLSALVVAGFLFAWTPEGLLHSMRSQRPATTGFVYGLSLSIISFVGLQALALAAAESRRPSRVMPRPAIALILTTVLFALSLTHLALGAVPPPVFGNGEAPLSALAVHIPPFSAMTSGLIAALACVVLLVSANGFLAGVSRLAYSMGQYDCLGQWSRQVHPRFQTPLKALVIFGAVIGAQLVLAFFWPGATALQVLANMYAFGAMLAYTLVIIAMIRLRFTEPHLPRPYRMPLNVPMTVGGRKREFPLLAIPALGGSLILLGIVVATHEIGRIAGPGWILLWTIYYLSWRRSRGLPAFGSIRRDWQNEQVRILEAADEADLVDRYLRGTAQEGRE